MAEFSQEAVFGNATFATGTSFIGVKFYARAAFGGATFGERANFVRARFYQEASFRWARFSERLTVLEAEFSESVDFYGATFCGALQFRRTRFSTDGEVVFRSSQFQGRHVFSDTLFAEARKVDFRDVVIDQPEALKLAGTDLTRCRFLGTDLRAVQLVGVTWPRTGAQFWHRQCVHDEQLLHEAMQDDAPWRPTPGGPCTALCTRETTGTCRLCEALQERERFLWGWLPILARVLRLKQRQAHAWEQMEQLYRQLKQHYEDQRASVVENDTKGMRPLVYVVIHRDVP
jgi:hypothetical protein